MKTLKALVTSTPEEHQRYVEFFQSLELPYYSDDELNLLANCLKVHQTTGVNYFNRYECLKYSVHHHRLHEGVAGFYQATRGTYYDHSDTLAHFKQEILSRVEDMQFFEIPQIQGLTPTDYLNLLSNSRAEYDAIQTKLHRQRACEKDAEIKKLCDKYFSTTAFEVERFDHYFKDSLASLTAHTYTEIELANTVRPTTPEDVYLIVLFSDGIPIKIGKTRHVAQWVGTHSPQFEAVTFGLYPVSEDYAEELVVRLCLELQTLSCHATYIKTTNQYYANLNVAKKVYAHLYGIRLPQLRKIISTNGLTQHLFDAVTLIEKAELDQHVRRFLKQTHRS